MPRTAENLETRFWRKVARRGPDECWLWTGSVFSEQRPYGCFGIKGRSFRAHRVAWSLANGRDIPAGKVVCHACDNPRCVNPAHIWLGTPLENMRDMLRKGRAHHQKNPRKPKPKEPKPRKPRPKATHCRRGHSYKEQKAYPSEAGKQRCVICHTARCVEAERRRIAAAKQATTN